MMGNSIRIPGLSCAYCGVQNLHCPLHPPAFVPRRSTPSPFPPSSFSNRCSVVYWVGQFSSVMTPSAPRPSTNSLIRGDPMLQGGRRDRVVSAPEEQTSTERRQGVHQGSLRAPETLMLELTTGWGQRALFGNGWW